MHGSQRNALQADAVAVARLRGRDADRFDLSSGDDVAQLTVQRGELRSARGALEAKEEPLGTWRDSRLSETLGEKA